MRLPAAPRARAGAQKWRPPRRPGPGVRSPHWAPDGTGPAVARLSGLPVMPGAAPLGVANCYPVIFSLSSRHSCRGRRPMINDLWYKNSIIYCLSVGTYMDSDGDGIGDFK